MLLPFCTKWFYLHYECIFIVINTKWRTWFVLNFIWEHNFGSNLVMLLPESIIGDSAVDGSLIGWKTFSAWKNFVAPWVLKVLCTVDLCDKSAIKVSGHLLEFGGGSFLWENAWIGWIITYWISTLKICLHLYLYSWPLPALYRELIDQRPLIVKLLGPLWAQSGDCQSLLCPSSVLLEHQSVEEAGASGSGSQPLTERLSQLLARHLGRSRCCCLDLCKGWAGSVMSADRAL